MDYLGDTLLAIIKIAALLAGLMLALVEERGAGPSAFSESRRRRMRILVLTLGISVAAEFVDLCLKLSTEKELRHRHEAVVSRLERLAHPLFPLGLTAEFRIDLSAADQRYLSRLDHAYRTTKFAGLQGTFLDHDSQPLTARFDYTSSLFPRIDEQHARDLLKAPLNVTVAFGEQGSTGKMRYHLVISNLQTDDSSTRLLTTQPGYDIFYDPRQFLTDIFTLVPDRLVNVPSIGLVTEEVILDRPAISDGSVISRKDLEGQNLEITVSSGCVQRPRLKNLWLRLPGNDTLSLQPVPYKGVNVPKSDEENPGDRYVARVSAT